MAKQTKNPVDEWCNRYERARPDYSRFTEKTNVLLRELLQASNLSFHLIESRTKELSSFRDKISRASKSYSDPLTELTDLSGLRVITYYQTDALQIGELIKSEFNIDEENTVEHSPSGSEFGYRSAHYVVRISNDRSRLLEWGGLAPFRLEIQVRTVLQHAWAAISHKLQYKREDDVPEQLRRKLFRLSALFELADDEFISLRDASIRLSDEITDKLSTGDQNLKIDHVSLIHYFEQSEAIAKLVNYAEEAGFSFNPPELESDDSLSISELIQLSFTLHINDISELDAIIKQSLPKASKYLELQYRSNINSIIWYADPAFICSLTLTGVFHSKLTPSDLVTIGWDEDIATRALEAASNFRFQ